MVMPAAPAPMMIKRRSCSFSIVSDVLSWVVLPAWPFFDGFSVGIDAIIDGDFDDAVGDCVVVSFIFFMGLDVVVLIVVFLLTIGVVFGAAVAIVDVVVVGGVVDVAMVGIGASFVVVLVVVVVVVVVVGVGFFLIVVPANGSKKRNLFFILYVIVLLGFTR